MNFLFAMVYLLAIVYLRQASAENVPNASTATPYCVAEYCLPPDYNKLEVPRNAIPQTS
jgi:hypothetical protein